MNKKIMPLAVLMIYISFALASPIVFAEENQSSGLFKSEISFDISTDLSAPIDPSQPTKVEIKVKYKLDMGPLAKWFFFKRRIGRLMLFGPGYFLKIKGIPQANATLSITDFPEWCTAVELDKKTLTFELNNEFVEDTVTLTFTIDENATALDKGDIVLSAESSIPWGKILKKTLLTFPGATNITSISVQVAYKSDIAIESESELTVPPLQNNTVPINITNNGNGKSTVAVQVETPENWNITLDPEEITLDVGQTKQMFLTYIPPEDFSDQSISLTFTPKSTSGEYEGTQVTSSITFHNDGSLKEDGGMDFSIIILILISIIVIIAIIAVILLLRRKKK
jgi:hypothetical protein